MFNPLAEVRDFFQAAFARTSGGDGVETADELVRRRWVSAVAVALGTFLVNWLVRIEPGDPTFYFVSVALALVWIAGGLLSGQLRAGSSRTRSGSEDGRAIVQALVLGVLLVGLFLAGAALVARVPALREPVNVLLDHVRLSPWPLVAALAVMIGVAEELYFRGGLYAAVGGRAAVAVTAAIYAVITLPSGVPLLVFAAAALGVVLGLQRRATGGVLGPIITHVVWLLGMVFLLPGALEP